MAISKRKKGGEVLNDEWWEVNGEFEKCRTVESCLPAGWRGIEKAMAKANGDSW